MIVASIHQPSYWPWLGLLNKIACTNLFVILDNVAANKESYQYRNIFFCNGMSKTLVLPVDYQLGKRINELKLKSNSWIDDHLNKLKNYYQKAPYFNEIFPKLEESYEEFRNIENASSIIIRTMKLSFEFFAISIDTITSSELSTNLSKGKLVLEICQKIGADVYLAGQGSREYMQEVLSDFKESNIIVNWHNFVHPIYSQHNKYPFVSGLSGLDVLFFNGIENARNIFWANVNRNRRQWDSTHPK